MKWIQLHIIVAIFLHELQDTNGTCITEKGGQVISCSSANIDDLYSCYYENYIHEANLLEYNLSIRNSDFKKITQLPYPQSCEWEHYNVLITKSGVTEISADCFRDWPKLNVLDFSYNNIDDTSFLSLVFASKVVLSHNKIEYIHADHLKEISYIDLRYNSIKDLHSYQTHDDFYFSDKVFDISFNQIKNLSLIPSNNWPNIIGTDNNLTYLAINRVVNASSLNLTNNRIRNNVFEAAYFVLDTLDFSKNHFGNSILVKPIKQRYIVLYNLILRENNITKIGEHCFKLIKVKNILDLSQNNISFIDKESFIYSDLLGEINLSSNKLEYLNNSVFEGLSDLKKLDLSYNPLKNIAPYSFIYLISLYSLNLSHCSLNNLDQRVFRGLDSILILDLSFNKLEFLPEYIFKDLSLDRLNLSNNFLKELSGNVFEGLTLSELNLKNNKGLMFGNNVFNTTNISSLLLQNSEIRKIDSNYFKDLKLLNSLNLSNCEIELISHDAFDNIQQLRTLDLSENFIESIPRSFLAGQTSLFSLTLKGNYILRIHQDAFSYRMKLSYLSVTLRGELLERRFSKLVHLQQLVIIDSKLNNIRKGSFRGLVDLKQIIFENSTIDKIEPGAFDGLNQVTQFNFTIPFSAFSKLNSYTFQGLKGLLHLNLSDAGIESIENYAFYGLDSLNNLNLSFNKITNLPQDTFIGLKKLKILDLSHNNISGKQSTFPIGIFRDFDNLNELHLQYNKIIKVHIGEFSNLDNLRLLNLSHNHLSYLDRHLLFPLKQLEVLDINSNNVIKFDYEFSIKHLRALDKIGLGSNKWRCENLTIMLSAFEKKGVDYKSISKLEYEIENIDGIYCVHVCNYLYCPTEEDLNITY